MDPAHAQAFLRRPWDSLLPWSESTGPVSSRVAAPPPPSEMLAGRPLDLDDAIAVLRAQAQARRS